ncbi:MAG: DMT family transporter [Syntrophales bacterium]|nr:DMT family transporter [Syntrophales bacterium]
MDGWYAYSFIALILFGLQRFLYKVSAEEKCDTTVTTFAFMGTVTCIGTILFFAASEPVDNIPFLVFISMVNSMSFFTGTWMTIESLKHIPASTAMPLIRLSTVLVVIYGIFFFGDRPSPAQAAGIALAMAVIMIIAWSPSQQGSYRGKQLRGIAFAMTALVAGSVAAISSAYAALYVNKLAFIALSYFMGMLFSVGIKGTGGSTRVEGSAKKALTIGLCIGIINFAGFYALLQALARGPLSIIIPFTGLYFVVAVLLSAAIYGEKMSMGRVTALILTILAVIIMRF